MELENMATKPTINDLSTNSRFTVSGINSRFTTLKNAFANVLGTNGVGGADNTMTGNLNMGSNKIVNLAAPTNSADAARKADITALQTQIDAINTTGTIPAGESFLISANDTTSNYGENKIIAGTGIDITVLSEGGNEQLEISTTATADSEQVLVSSNDTTAGYLNGKLVAGTGIEFTEGSDGGDETLTIACTVTQETDVMLFKDVAISDSSEMTNNNTANVRYSILDLGTVTAGEIWEIDTGAYFTASASDHIILYVLKHSGTATYDGGIPGGGVAAAGIATSYIGNSAPHTNTCLTGSKKLFITGTGTLTIRCYVASYLGIVTMNVFGGYTYAYKIKDAPA
jgi:hypothetical protein